MKVDIKNIDYQEFLSLISGLKAIDEYVIRINYEDEIIGTLEQLNELAKNVDNLDFKRFVSELNEESNKEISDVEVKKYLKELTDGFDVELTKTALFELEVFENLIFDETIDAVVLKKYIDEGWKIPTYEKVDVITQEVKEYNDSIKMRNKVFPFLGMQLFIAKKYLQKALQSQNNPELEIESNQTYFINNFDNIKPVDVYTHFKTNLVDKGYLTMEELKEYLKAAFEMQTTPKSLFRLKNTPNKQKIYTVFYTYYKDIAGKIHSQQSQYVELLGNYFEGYNNDTIRTNWARGYKVKW